MANHQTLRIPVVLLLLLHAPSSARIAGRENRSAKIGLGGQRPPALRNLRNLIELDQEIRDNGEKGGRTKATTSSTPALASRLAAARLLLGDDLPWPP